MLSSIRVPHKVLRDIDAQLAASKKIGAIKVLRTHHPYGLREAKMIIEDRMGQTSSGYTLKPTQLFRVKSFLIETVGDESDAIEVDMEGLKLKFLMELPEIGIAECAELLKLVQFVEKWQACE